MRAGFITASKRALEIAVTICLSTSIKPLRQRETGLPSTGLLLSVHPAYLRSSRLDYAARQYWIVASGIEFDLG